MIDCVLPGELVEDEVSETLCSLLLTGVKGASGCDISINCLTVSHSTRLLFSNIYSELGV